MKITRILFSGPMVREILAGNKDVTRRVISPQPVITGNRWTWKKHSGLDEPALVDLLVKTCSYGGEGDGLYVCEAWRASDALDKRKPREMARDTPIKYEADGATKNGVAANYGRYRHGRFMPSHFSRIDLSITRVEAERLQDIANNHRDMKAEGMPGDTHEERVQAFREGIDRLNGPGTWATNPWVYPIRFSHITGGR